jgi:hypothetical protein
VRATEASLAKAGPQIEHAAAALQLAKVEHERMKSAGERIASKADLDRAAYAERMRAADLDTAKFQEQVARFELDLARAALARTRPGGNDGTEARLRVVRRCRGGCCGCTGRRGGGDAGAAPAGTPVMCRTWKLRWMCCRPMR